MSASYQYERPAAAGGLRLHLNENTAGCSPRVLEAMRGITREEAAVYPEYDDAIEACARSFGIEPASLLLTNGLDEGILLTSIVAFRGMPASAPGEGIVVQPAFDMYAACVDGAGGRIVNVAPAPDFAFPLDAVRGAVGPATRVIFLTNPNNPTGVSIPSAAVAALAAAAPHAVIFLDEAYADFAGTTMIPQAASGAIPNLVVGRTFAKAYGLAGVRAGAVVASLERLEPMRRLVPPYTLNVFANAALPAALADLDYHRWYVAQVRESRELLYAALARLDVPFWRSDGNFVLARFGAALPAVLAGLAARGIAIRDRSRDPGCAGCARITAGVVEHTHRLLTALEEILCGAR